MTEHSVTTRCLTSPLHGLKIRVNQQQNHSLTIALESSTICESKNIYDISQNFKNESLAVQLGAKQV